MGHGYMHCMHLGYLLQITHELIPLAAIEPRVAHLSATVVLRVEVVCQVADVHHGVDSARQRLLLERREGSAVRLAHIAQPDQIDRPALDRGVLLRGEAKR